MIDRRKKPNPRRHIALQIVPELYGRIAKQAAAQDRSISNMVKVALIEWLEVQEAGAAPIAEADKTVSPARARVADTKRERGS